MYKHILIPTDGSPLSEQAAAQGIAFAKAVKAKVTAVTVSPTFHALAVDPVMVTSTPAQYGKECEARAEKCLGAVRALAATSGVPYEGVHVVHDGAWEAIIDTAKGQGCDLIFMASHGRRGVSALVLGSETLKVLTHSKIPTLVYR